MEFQEKSNLIADLGKFILENSGAYPNELFETVVSGRLTKVLRRFEACYSNWNGVLDLKNIKLNQLELAFCLDHCSNNLAQINELVLQGNQLDAVPNSVADLRDLKTLNLSNNRLKELPDLSACNALRSLDISHNEFGEIPSRVWNLANLWQLYAANNNLTELPQVCIDMINNRDRTSYINLSANNIWSLNVNSFNPVEQFHTLLLNWNPCLEALENLPLQPDPLWDKREMSERYVQRVDSRNMDLITRKKMHGQSAHKQQIRVKNTPGGSQEPFILI